MSECVNFAVDEVSMQGKGISLANNERIDTGV